MPGLWGRAAVSSPWAPPALALPCFQLSAIRFASPEPLSPDRGLSFYNTHTGESATVAEYCRSGCLVPASLEKIDRILRDHRTGETKDIDVRLLDLLDAPLRRESLPAGPSTSSPATGRPGPTSSSGRTGDGVAANSLHLAGSGHRHPPPRPRAEEALPGGGRPCAAAGSGSMRRSDFVHVDVGRVRTW
ncbi:MAG: DUF882 domain-containing protein [Sphingobacterium sp.]|nr:DUF882 domain-containing protein [Sphingobacterium sp.]